MRRMKRSVAGDGIREQIYESLCRSLRSGKYIPGEKLTIRSLASEFGASLTPVRESLHRLTAEGVLVAQANRSARVASLSGEQIRELRDIRIINECCAAERAAKLADDHLVGRLRAISAELDDARARGDLTHDLALVYQFQFELYRASGMMTLVQLIESLWLRTGPYLKLLFPEYVSAHPHWRKRVCVALERNDPEGARQEIHRDLSDALNYVAGIVDAADRLANPA